jgi:hypothetical protein
VYCLTQYSICVLNSRGEAATGAAQQQASDMVILVHERSIQAKHMRTKERLDDDARDHAKYVYVVGARATTSNLYTQSVLSIKDKLQAHAIRPTKRAFKY